jgi:sigma-B regulation protein RsbU (phosphoserine phosphatase)
MDYWILLILLAATALGFGLYIRRSRRRLGRIRREREALETGEARMFSFLHVLGEAIETDTTPSRLYHMIVDGVEEVVNARGGALYLINDERDLLAPKYISEDCPPLIGLPLDVLQKGANDPRAIESYMRLAQVRVDEGILGHCLMLGQAIHVPDIKSHEAFRDAFSGFRGDVAAMVAPLRHAGMDIGVLAVARNHEDGPFKKNDFDIFKSMAEQSSFALGNAMIHMEAHEKRKLEEEFRTAREVQRVLLPAENPVLPGYRISGTNVPARIISGDYYDYLDLGERRHGIAIADVSGKGLPAGLLMAMCRSVLRALSDAGDSPAAILAKVNRQLFPDIREDMFISMVYAVLDGDGGRVVMARAGHDSPLLYRRATAEVTILKPPGLAVGIDEGSVFERITRDFEIELQSGDCLLLYTDGVREAINDADEEFGIERMIDAFRTYAKLGAEASVLGVQREVVAFVDGAPQMDDITLVAIEKR